MPDAPVNAFSARLDPLDWVVIAAYALGMLGIGWWYGRKNADTDDYLVGGGNMSPVAVGLSFFVALFSTITYLAVPGEMVRHGPVIFGGLLALPVVFLLAGYFIIPVFMKLNVNSGYSLLEARLGAPVRMLGVALFLVMRVMWMGVIIFATVDKVLVPLLGLDESATPLLCLILAGLTIVYTALGGLKAIVTVDVIQTCLLFGGVLMSLGLITYQLGGVDNWWPDAWPAHWQQAHILPGQDGQRSILAAFIAVLVWFTCTAGSDQMAVQRYLATRDAAAARKMLGISLVASCGIQLILGCLGVALLSYATHNPDWVPAGQTVYGAADQLFPSFIVSSLPAGLAGLIIAGLLAEAMNSLSSGMNAASAVITTDLLGRVRRVALTADQELRGVRWVSVGVGLLVTMLSIGVSYIEGNLLELAYKVVNLLTAPLFSLFFMAIFIRWATTLGTLLGASAGVAVAVIVNYWRELATVGNFLFGLEVDTDPPISFLWGTPLSFLTAAVVGMVTSLLPFGITAQERSERLDLESDTPVSLPTS